MNRHLQAAPDGQATPFRAVALTPTVPRSLAGPAPTVAMASLAQFAVRSRAGAAFERLYGGHESDVLHGTGRDTFAALDYLRISSGPRRPRP